MNILAYFYRPWNKLTIVGTLTIIAGFLLSPLVIGLPILVLGFMIGGAGIFYSIYQSVIDLIPHGREKVNSFKKQIIDSYRPYFRKNIK